MTADSSPRPSSPSPMRTCAACGYAWTPRVQNPVMCPRCHTSKWRGTDSEGRTIREAEPLPAAPRLTCTRCGNEWTPRKGTTPKVCPACNSRFWNRERTRDIPERMRARRKTPAARADAPCAVPAAAETVRIRALCPQCGGEIDVDVRVLACAKCGARWIQRGLAPPARCPSCGQKNWAEGWTRPPSSALSFSPGGDSPADGDGSLVLRP